MPEIQVFIHHSVAPELVDYLKRVETYSELEIRGDFAILTVYDPDTIPDDIRKISREAERINNIYNKLGWPWMAREVLDRKAIIKDGTLHYLKPKSRIRREVENSLGELISDDEFSDILEAVTRDIVVNRLTQGKLTTVEEVIKIAARCAKALKRCGT